MLHISLAGETLFTVLGFSVTNSLLTTWVVMAILIFVATIVSSDLKLYPTRFQVAAELVVGGMYTTFQGILGNKTAAYFPLVMTFFVFIIAGNWFGLIPGVGSIGIAETPMIPLLRAPTADLNTTFALALISVIAIQVAGIRALGGMAYIGKFITFKDPISFYVGLLELVSELGKILSFAFRLFGNIFAGEVLLAVVAFLIPYFAPVPFLGLEIFVGFIQALVFAMLTAVFLSAATAHSAH